MLGTPTQIQCFDLVHLNIYSTSTLLEQKELVLSPPANPPHGAAAAAAATRYSLSDLPCGEMEKAGQWCCLTATHTIVNQIINLLTYAELRYFFKESEIK